MGKMGKLSSSIPCCPELSLLQELSELLDLLTCASLDDLAFRNTMSLPLSFIVFKM